jgi:uncharacterized protein YbjT (DUF2867 family)
MESPLDANPAMLVTGGTGTLGRLVVAGLRESGRPVRVLSRGRRAADLGGDVDARVGDLATGEGVRESLEGVEVVVHLAGGRTGDGAIARTLVEAATAAGVRHLVYVSVVGDERVPVEGRLDRAMFGYFASKLAAERTIGASGVPWTTLHATQFHELTFATARGLARLPVIPTPAAFRFQPVDAGEVANRLVELALGSPAGLVPDLAGPRAYTLAELVRSYLAAVGRRRPVLELPMPGRAAAAIRAGANLAPDRAVGHVTWEAFLAARVARAADHMGLRAS